MPPASDIPLDVAGIISTVLEGVLYGTTPVDDTCTSLIVDRLFDFYGRCDRLGAEEGPQVEGRA